MADWSRSRLSSNVEIRTEPDIEGLAELAHAILDAIEDGRPLSPLQDFTPTITAADALRDWEAWSKTAFENPNTDPFSQEIGDLLSGRSTYTGPGAIEPSSLAGRSSASPASTGNPLAGHGLSDVDYAMSVGAIMGEALNEGLVGMGVVAASALNRAENAGRFGARSASLGDVFAAPHRASDVLAGRRTPGVSGARQYSTTYNSNSGSRLPHDGDLSGGHADPRQDPHGRATAGHRGATPLQHAGSGGWTSRHRSEGASQREGAGGWKNNGGVGLKMCNGPHVPGWRLALALAGASARCGAKRRCDGGACQQPAMKNGRCRLHGGKSTGPRTKEGRERARRARLVHGHYTAARKRERAIARAELRSLRGLLAQLW